jgi:UDP-N-acetylmuramate--alanine ligase
VSGESVARRISELGHKQAWYMGSFTDAIAAALAIAQPGDMILTLGAGSVSQLGPQIVEALRGREQAAGAVTK